MSDLDKDIERQVVNTMEYYKNIDNLEEIPIDILRVMYKDNLSELEELREDNYAYHQLMKMQNAREYRSKFLKDFKKEFGENVMPDYDEIYIRYDKQKKEIKNKDKDLELWKKMAEFLAKNSVRAKCERCVEDLDENGCIRCMLNWAKSEVLKNE